MVGAVQPIKLLHFSVDNFVDRSRFVARIPYESRALLHCTKKQQNTKIQWNQPLADFFRRTAQLAGGLKIF
jgi:endo-beta-N-acetylglucosaminidase D